MAKYYGTIGFETQDELRPGVWGPVVTERRYFGDILKNTRRWQNGQSINDDLNVSNTFSIVADPYAMDHFHTMKYIEWMGTKWKITDVDVQYPRLNLSVGGVYNANPTGPQA